MRTLTTAFFLLSTFAMAGAPAPELSVKVQTPQPHLRSISPAEVQAAYDSLAREKGLPVSQPAPNLDSAPSIPAIAASTATSAPMPQMIATPEPPFPMAIPEHHLERVAPDEHRFPIWEGAMPEHRLPSHSSRAAEIQIEDQWPGLVVAVELRPEKDFSAKPVRFLMLEKSMEDIEASPDVSYDLIIQARRPGSLVWIKAYEFKSRVFKGGYLYNLVLPRELSSELLKSIDLEAARIRNATATPAPVQYNLDSSNP
mgnify:CR=1 FL=1